MAATSAVVAAAAVVGSVAVLVAAAHVCATTRVSEGFRDRFAHAPEVV